MKHQMTQRIEFRRGQVLTIEVRDNGKEVHLSFENTKFNIYDTISFPDAGVPGIIGPGITLNLQDLVEKAEAEAIKDAGFDSVEIIETKDN